MLEEGVGTLGFIRSTPIDETNVVLGTEPKNLIRTLTHGQHLNVGNLGL